MIEPVRSAYRSPIISSASIMPPRVRGNPMLYMYFISFCWANPVISGEEL